VDCPGCKMQIEGGLEAEGSSIKVEHTATLVNRNLM
jgi:Fe-S oxidoreductase